MKFALVITGQENYTAIFLLNFTLYNYENIFY